MTDKNRKLSKGTLFKELRVRKSTIQESKFVVVEQKHSKYWLSIKVQFHWKGWHRNFIQWKSLWVKILNSSFVLKTRVLFRLESVRWLGFNLFISFSCSCLYFVVSAFQIYIKKTISTFASFILPKAFLSYTTFCHH